MKHLQRLFDQMEKIVADLLADMTVDERMDFLLGFVCKEMPAWIINHSPYGNIIHGQKEFALNVCGFFKRAKIKYHNGRPFSLGGWLGHIPLKTNPHPEEFAKRGAHVEYTHGPVREPSSVGTSVPVWCAGGDRKRETE